MDKIANYNRSHLRFGSLCEQHRKTLVSEVGFEPTPTLVWAEYSASQSKEEP